MKRKTIASLIFVLDINVRCLGDTDSFLNPPVEIVETILCNRRINMAFLIDTSMLIGHFEQQRMERKYHSLRVHAVVKQLASLL